MEEGVDLLVSALCLLAQIDHVEKEVDAVTDRLDRALSFVRQTSVLPNASEI